MLFVSNCYLIKSVKVFVFKINKGHFKKVYYILKYELLFFN